MNKKKFNYIIVLVMFVGLVVQNILWFAPAPFLSIIIEDLQMNMMQGGIIVSIVGLIAAIVGMFLGVFFGKIGVKKTFSIALIFMGIGSLLTFFVNSFYSILLTRILVGIGFGFCLPVAGTVIMIFFTREQRPYLNTVNSLLPYIATMITFSLTIPIYKFLNESWRATLMIPGIFSFLVLILWQGMYNERERGYPIEVEEGKLNKKEFKDLVKNKEILFLIIAETCDMWSFEFTTTYLATFFYKEAGLTLAKSSYIMSLFPIAGIIAGLSCGILMGKVGLRKPFTWPMHLIIFIGTFMALNCSGFLRLVGVFLAGFGNAGWAPALFTMPMEFVNVNPEMIAKIYSLMLSSGLFAAFLSPFLGGFLNNWLSLHDVILIFSCSSLIAAVSTFLMKETGSYLGKTAHK